MKKFIRLRTIVCLTISGFFFPFVILIKQLVVPQNISLTVVTDDEITSTDCKKSAEHPKLPFNCNKLFEGDESESLVAIDWVYESAWNDDVLKRQLENCSSFKKALRITEHSYSSEETEFPLAFSMILAQNAEQFLRLFASIYRSHNIYCLTYDEKASHMVKYAVHRMSECFENVLEPDGHETITWGAFSVLRAALNCLQKLTEQVDHNWKYHQIVSWSDVPLKSNLEMVRILRGLNGSSDSQLLEGQSSRYSHHVEWIANGSPFPLTWKKGEISEQYGSTFFFNKRIKKLPPPGGLTIYKGSFAATLSRSVAEFITHNELVKNLTEWLSDTFIPDEFLWATVLFNRDVLRLPTLMDGNACLANISQHLCGKQSISRYQLWPHSDTKCKGKWVHGSCVFGVRDLPKLRTAPQLFAHKMYLDFQPVTFFCMLQLIENRTERHNQMN